SGDLSDAASRLRKVMEETDDRELALVARLRLARVQIAQEKPDDAIATLNAVADPGAFAARFHEVRGDALYAKSDKAGALKEYLAARAGTGIGSVDAELLELKINDLEGEGITPAGDSAPSAAGGAAPTESAPKATDSATPSE
ncbi:MAG TPA: tetratricopeptide repeat protein, partial [Steroidobacteraceae bacterium]